MNATQQKQHTIAALQFAATVAIMCRDDYGLTLKAYPTSLWLETLYDEYEAGVSMAHAAFVVSNTIQKG